MKTPELVRLEADLRKYLQGKDRLFAPGVEKVIARVNEFTSAILQTDFQQAVAALGIDFPSDRPFVEVCDAIVERQVGFLRKADQELMAKSLFEAYVYLAGSERALEPPRKTKIVPSLRRRGTKGFAGSLLSLHLFNIVSMEIQDDVKTKVPDLKSFEIYMLWIETVCRHVVAAAMAIPDGGLDEKWAAAVCSNVETRLLGSR